MLLSEMFGVERDTDFRRGKGMNVVQSNFKCLGEELLDV